MADSALQAALDKSDRLDNEINRLLAERQDVRDSFFTSEGLSPSEQRERLVPLNRQINQARSDYEANARELDQLQAGNIDVGDDKPTSPAPEDANSATVNTDSLSTNPKATGDVGRNNSANNFASDTPGTPGSRRNNDNAADAASTINTSNVPNPLSQFSSYSTIITLGVLSKAELANPDTTYRTAPGPQRVILKSGGVGDSKIRTSYEQNLNIDTEYYIEDLEIDALIGFGNSTRQTNATLFGFKVIEPYSMGLFLETLAVTALDADETVGSYLDAAYVLIVEFIGYDDEGNSFSIPNTKRFFPLKLGNLNFNVTAGGSVYDIQAYAWNDQALADEVQRINQDVDLVGETVADLLQIAVEEEDKSLTFLMNKYQLAQKEAGSAKSADFYVIVFPGTNDSESDSFRGEIEDPQGATSVPPQIGATVDRIAEDGVNIDDIKDFAQNVGNINEIGRSRVNSETFTSGNNKFGTADIELEDGLAYRNGLQFDKNKRYINIEGGNRIQDIIENIILVSDYGKQLSTSEPDDRGMLKWFRIETETYDVVDKENVKQRGRSAKIYVYRVVPYLIHASHFVGPSQTSPGVGALKGKIPKSYNYIYSGLNSDIIDFDITFNTAFYNAIQFDLAQLGKKIQTDGAFASGFQNFSLQGITPPSDDREDTDNEPTSQTLSSTQANTGPTIINGAEETPETAISRAFNDVIVSGIDLITAEMEILGDPYYMATSGLGNFRASRAGNQTMSDGSIDYQYEEAHLILNFRTPVDLDQETGTMQFPTDGEGKTVRKFSGIYRVVRLTNSISGNKFTQRLQMIRVRNQLGTDTEETGILTFTDKTLLDVLGISGKSLVPIPGPLELPPNG